MVRRLMLRGLGISITAWALCVPGLAAALGVGEYELHSYLNEPLNLEVSLTDLRDLTEEELRVSLASESDFERAGVERQAMHADLRFNIDLRPDGTGVVTITTRQPVREPYVSFLVEYLWPTGRLLREYTVLLDPPSYAASFNEQVAPARQQAPHSAPQPSAQPPARQATRPLATADAPAPAAPSAYRPADSSGPRRTHTVRADETLWRIASQNRPTGSVSVQQMMVVIQQMNQDAFINGNVNLVREGAVLRLPNEQEVREISTRDAIARVAEQNRQWRDMLQARGLDTPSRQPLDGTPRTIEGGLAGSGQDSGRVTLVAPDSASGEGRGAGSTSAGRSGGTASGDTAALQNELAIRDENLDRLRRENNELGSRLDDLEAQVNTGEQLLKLRNDQISRLQDELRRLQEERGVAVSDDSLLQPVPALEGADDTNDSESADALAAGETTGGDDGTQVAEAPAPGGEEEVAAEGDSDAQDTPAVAPAPAARQAPPAPRVTPPPAPQPSLLDQILGNPLILGAAALVLALLALLVVRRRKAAAEADAADEDTDAFAEEDDFGDDDDFLPAIGDDDDDVPLMADQDDDAAPAQDPLEQVDVFMAYGQYPQALSHLRSAINAEPGRIDLKKRLLDVLAESNDKPGFDQEATKLAGLNDELDRHIAALRPRLGGAPQDVEEELSFDDLAMDLSEPSSAAPAAGLADDDDGQALDFSADLSGNTANDDGLTLDDDDLGDFELTLPEAEPTLAADDEDSSLSFSLDDTPAAADNRYSLNGDDDSLSDEEVSAALSADPVLELDSDLGTLDSDDSMDFGELKLDDVSDEFADTGRDSVTEESLDLSLDDLSLDDLDTGRSTAAGTDDDALTLSLDEDDLDDALSLDDTLSGDETPAGTPVVTAAAPAPALADDAGLGDDDDFDFLGETDENATKLDLARAYIDMGDTEGARDILNEVVAEGNDQQQTEARELLSQVG